LWHAEAMFRCINIGLVLDEEWLQVRFVNVGRALRNKQKQEVKYHFKPLAKGMVRAMNLGRERKKKEKSP
jgi:hypothetical protein